MLVLPDYLGGSVVNLSAELEVRLTGSSVAPPLHRELAVLVPRASTYVLVLFDGLGDHQLAHRAAAPLAVSRVGALDAVFPTTTTVNLASVVTGMPPSRHGLLGYQQWIPEVGAVLNTIKWTTLYGDPVEFDTAQLLPEPNLWERLAAHGREAITVQPANFAGSPLSRALYRGCRTEDAYSIDDIVEATQQLAAAPGRIVFTYVPHVDFAAHVFGQRSPEYTEALATVGAVWERLVQRLPDDAVAVGIADHGHVDFPEGRQVKIERSLQANRVFYGDSRVMFVKGEDPETLAADLPAEWVPLDELRSWWGPGPHHPSFEARAPTGALVADDGSMVLHKASDDRMIGNHGGLTDAERRVPLLVAP
jgi:hypothetical protein